MKFRCLVIVSILVLLLPSLALAHPGPKAYLVEQVRAHYETNGSLASDPSYGKCNDNLNPCKYGYVQAAPPNNEDVLQYLKITLGGDLGKTNLINAVTHKGTLGSSTYPDRISFSDGHNTTELNGNDLDDAYEINGTGHANDAPPIMLNATITNWEGGYDLYDYDNIGSGGSSNVLNFTLNITNPSSGKAVYDFDIAIQFEQNKGPGGQDIVNIATVPTTTGSGTPGRSNPGGGAQYDRATLTTEDLSPGSSVYFSFNITINETQNFPGGDNDIDLDEGTQGPTAGHGAQADYGNLTSTFTGYTITSRFSRGPIRQGIDLAGGGGSNWTVRGFLTNMGKETPAQGDYLRYNLSEWNITQIDSSTGTPMTPANQSGTWNGTSGYILTPGYGRLKTTDSEWSGNTQWFNTETTSKPYYGFMVDWQVEWNTTTYEGFINTTYDLTTLYKIDMSNVKALSGAVNPGTEDNVTVVDKSTMLGHNNSAADFIEILSVVPARPENKQGENDHGNWTIHEDSSLVVSAWYDGSWHDVTGEATITVTQPDCMANTEGLVNVTIADISGSSIGDLLKTNEEINVTFIVTSSTETKAGDVFNFTGNTTMKTDSGTPLTEIIGTEQVNLAGMQLTGWKQLIGYDPSNPSLIDVGILVEVTSDNIDTKIQNIKFLDYIPNGTDIDGNITALREAVTVKYYNGSEWLDWADGTNFNISNNGTVTLPDGLIVNAYEFWNTSAGGGGWNLGNTEKINVTYQMNVTSSGAYVLPTIISGFDPVTGIEFSTMAIGAIYVDIPTPLLPLEIDEGDFSQAKMAIVNKPVLWMKDFDAYNPNGRPAKSKFSVNVFSDTSKGYATYYDEYGSKVEEVVDLIVTKEGKRMVWESTINPFESRSYEVRILTPPVMEVDRNVEVLEKLPNKKVKIIMDVFLKNFGKEDYENVVLNLPIGVDDILKARDSFGRELQFSGGRDSSKIMTGDIKSEGMKSVNIIYKQSYPTIIVTPEKDEFLVGSPIGLNILVINGGEEIDYPYLEIEIYTPGMDIIASDIKKIEKLQPLEKTELTERYFLPVSAPTGLYLASVSFREDFVTLASGTGQFFLTGSEKGLTQTWGWILLLIVIILMGFLSFKRIQSVRKDVSKRFKVM